MDPIDDVLAELRENAVRLTDSADTANPSSLPGLVDNFELLLKELSMACYALGLALGETRLDGSQLTHAERERALAALHDIGAAVGAAARVCRAQRGGLLTATSETPAVWPGEVATPLTSSR